MLVDPTAFVGLYPVAIKLLEQGIIKLCHTTHHTCHIYVFERKMACSDGLIDCLMISADPNLLRLTINAFLKHFESFGKFKE